MSLLYLQLVQQAHFDTPKTSRSTEGEVTPHPSPSSARDMRHLLPTVLSKGEAPTVMNAIMLSFEVSASHGNCFPLSYEMAVPATTPPHGRGAPR